MFKAWNVIQSFLTSKNQESFHLGGDDFHPNKCTSFTNKWANEKKNTYFPLYWLLKKGSLQWFPIIPTSLGSIIPYYTLKLRVGKLTTSKLSLLEIFMFEKIVLALYLQHKKLKESWPMIVPLLTSNKTSQQKSPTRPHQNKPKHPAISIPSIQAFQKKASLRFGFP